MASLLAFSIILQGKVDPWTSTMGSNISMLAFLIKVVVPNVV
jgi:hypothetical protein